MYSVVLMAALTVGADAPDTFGCGGRGFLGRHRSAGCYGAGYGFSGGGYGGCYGGGYGGGYGGCYGGG